MGHILPEDLENSRNGTLGHYCPVVLWYYFHPSFRSCFYWFSPAWALLPGTQVPDETIAGLCGSVSSLRVCRAWGKAFWSPMQEIGCVPRLPGPACSCSSDTGEPKPTFLGMAGQQMQFAGLFSAENWLAQHNGLLATHCWLSTASGALFCQPCIMSLVSDAPSSSGR